VPRATKPRSKTAADVAEHLKDRVRRGSLVPGQRLVEADIVQDTGASRSRVREALRQLAAEGLVSIETFRGASIKRLSREEVDQIYRAREALEGAAARLFAERAKPEQLRALAQAQAEMNDCEARGDRDQYGALNERWHALILRASGNAYMQAFVERLRLPVFRMQFGMFFTGDTMASSNVGHRAVTAAILAGRGEEAERCMRAHVLEGLVAIDRNDDEFFAR
jgi:DNA-binding GntR family transcriptional regulator